MTIRVVVAALALLCGRSAMADTFTTYSLQNVLSASGVQATGTVALDDTTHLFTSGNILLTGLAGGNVSFGGTPVSSGLMTTKIGIPIDGVTFEAPLTGPSYPTGDEGFLVLYYPLTPVPDGTNSINLCITAANVCPVTFPSEVDYQYQTSFGFVSSGDLADFSSGALVPGAAALAVTPEPTSLVLLGTGALGTGALGVAGAWKRRRSVAVSPRSETSLR